MRFRRCNATTSDQSAWIAYDVMGDAIARVISADSEGPRVWVAHHLPTDGSPVPARAIDAVEADTAPATGWTREDAVNRLLRREA